MSVALKDAPLVAVRQATVGFGGRPLFTAIDIALTTGMRGCLVGRNGCGKSSLLKLLAGQIEPDAGERWIQPGVRMGYLGQESQDKAAVTAKDYVLAAVSEQAGLAQEARALAVLDQLGGKAGAFLAELSGGERRRVDLARALAGDPDILVLDEPTNHLDLSAIAWLEGYLARFHGAALVISHDRRFLRAVSNCTWYLDRGVLHRLERGFEVFEAWRERLDAGLEKQAHKTERRIVHEVKWLREGIGARRTRNMSRVRALQSLRQNFAERAKEVGQAVLEASVATRHAGTLVMEAVGVGKRYGERLIFGDVCLRILRGARIGVVGPNGAGKSTLLRLLTGQIAPDDGVVRHGEGLEVAYYDQQRTLPLDLSLWQCLCPGGGDQILVGGKPRHAVGYLKQFLFSEAQAMAPVHSLSGGERSRLLLALLFARPSNVLVLDEPTNDLDIDTLDVLQEMLADYAGVVLLVSHDRDFLDRVVTSIVAVEGDGTVQEYAGGYSDYALQRASAATKVEDKPARKPLAPPAPSAKRVRLGYKEQREREQLPGLIEVLEGKVAQLEGVLSDPALYERSSRSLEEVADSLAQARLALVAAEERWLELEMKQEALDAEKS